MAFTKPEHHLLRIYSEAHQDSIKQHCTPFNRTLHCYLVLSLTHPDMEELCRQFHHIPLELSTCAYQHQNKIYVYIQCYIIQSYLRVRCGIYEHFPEYTNINLNMHIYVRPNPKLVHILCFLQIAVGARLCDVLESAKCNSNMLVRFALNQCFHIMWCILGVWWLYQLNNQRGLSICFSNMQSSFVSGTRALMTLKIGYMQSLRLNWDTKFSQQSLFI